MLEGGGVCSLANYIVAYEDAETELPIFVLLRVLCLQKQPFRFCFSFSAYVFL